MNKNHRDFIGLYCGVVVSNADPAKVGRIQVRVPILHGIGASNGSIGFIDDSMLPWALPASLPSGITPESGGISWIPVAGDQVWVRFLDGELEKPVWEWGNQHVQGIKNFGEYPIHQYNEETGDSVRRAALTRYWHWIELYPWGEDIWTKSGYHFTITDEQTPGTPSGKIEWKTALGYQVVLDDLTETLTSYCKRIESVCETSSMSASGSSELTTPLLGLNIGTIEFGGDYSDFELNFTTRTQRGVFSRMNHLSLEITDDFLLSCSSFGITDSGINIGSKNYGSPKDPDRCFGVSGGNVALGRSASDPVVRLSDLIRALTRVKQVFDSHVHKDSGGSGDSGVPKTAAEYSATGSATVKIDSISIVDSVKI